MVFHHPTYLSQLLDYVRIKLNMAQNSFQGNTTLPSMSGFRTNAMHNSQNWKPNWKDKCKETWLVRKITNFKTDFFVYATYNIIVTKLIVPLVGSPKQQLGKFAQWRRKWLSTTPKFTHVLRWVSPSLKYFVLKHLQVGVCTNPPDRFQFCLKELNSCYLPKGLILPLTGEGINTHTHQEELP